MKYYVQVNGREQEVDVRERLGELIVSVNGEPMDFSFEEVDALGQAAILVDGRAFGVSIEGSGEQFSVAIAGQRYDVDIEDERERAAHAAEGKAGPKSGLVKSVMPGVVVKLLVAEGDPVQAGQPLLILEAMKMQNEIAAPEAGVVRGIHVTEGQAVAGGTKLATIEIAE